ncbi:hypothetical protein PJP07_30125, partial [Mycobacterium kansasii]
TLLDKESWIVPKVFLSSKNHSSSVFFSGFFSFLLEECKGPSDTDNPSSSKRQSLNHQTSQF